MPATAPTPPAGRCCWRCCSRSRPTPSRRWARRSSGWSRATPRAPWPSWKRSRGDLPAAKGGAELRLLAGRLAAASNDPALAERLYREAASREAPATAPAAELALAELMLDARRTAEAVTQLEHLILTYPESALVPQARRALDVARGAVPQT